MVIEDSLNGLSATLDSMYRFNSEYPTLAEFTIIFEDKKYFFHKGVLIALSDFFAKRLPFSCSGSQTPSTAIIKSEGMTHELMEKIVKISYGQYITCTDADELRALKVFAKKYNSSFIDDYLSGKDTRGWNQDRSKPDNVVAENAATSSRKEKTKKTELETPSIQTKDTDMLQIVGHLERSETDLARKLIEVLPDFGSTITSEETIRKFRNMSYANFINFMLIYVTVNGVSEEAMLQFLDAWKTANLGKFAILYQPLTSLLMLNFKNDIIEMRLNSSTYPETSKAPNIKKKQEIEQIVAKLVKSSGDTQQWSMKKLESDMKKHQPKLLKATKKTFFFGGYDLKEGGAYEAENPELPRHIVYDHANKMFSELDAQENIFNGAKGLEMRNNIYLFGGVDHLGRESKKVFVYGADINEWYGEETAAMPFVRKNFEVATAFGHIFLIGGNDDNQAVVQRYDMNHNKYIDVPSKVGKLSGSSAVVYNNVIYCFGGNGRSVCRLDARCPAGLEDISRTWKINKSFAGTCLNGNHAFVVGGKNDKGKYIGKVEAYDFICEKYENLKSLTQGRSNVS
uniref:BTB domain-containing protein n=1 Tax=Rhabditophanes sp. KR3021 TaxID=114890 RepID=A0AC35TQP3_9BILA